MGVKRKYCPNTWGHKDTGTQRHRDTKIQGQKTQGHNDTGTQRHRDTETQEGEITHRHFRRIKGELTNQKDFIRGDD